MTINPVNLTSAQLQILKQIFFPHIRVFTLSLINGKMFANFGKRGTKAFPNKFVKLVQNFSQIHGELILLLKQVTE